MRIRLYIPSRLSDDTDGAAEAFVSELRQALEAQPDVDIVEENPDVVHLLGCWNKDVDQQMKRCRRLRIPTVYSPLGGLSPWSLTQHSTAQERLRQKRTTRSANLVQVWGPEEKAEILRRKWATEITVVKNSATAIDFSLTDLASAMTDIYNKVAVVHDKAIRINIDKHVAEAMDGAEDDAKEVARRLLYAHYYMGRGELPQAVLNDLSETMLHAEYDEEDFAADLKAMGIYDFTARLEQLMAETASLTEGFMPIVAINDKKTNKLKSIITQYDIPH